jgi:hypothetical protein
VLIALLIAQSILLAGLLFTVLWPGQPVEAEPVVVATYFSGLSLPAVLLLLTAVFAHVVAGTLAVPGVGVLGFGGSASLLGLGAVVASVAGGLALWRFDTPLRERLAALPANPVPSLLRLDWFYQLVWGVINTVGTAVGNVAAVFEGEGAILWTLVAGVLVWLIWKGA